MTHPKKNRRTFLKTLTQMWEEVRGYLSYCSDRFESRPFYDDADEMEKMRQMEQLWRKHLEQH